jgi:hypothetical protein
VKRRGGPRRLSGYTAGADCKSGNMADTSSTEGSQQFSTHVSRRRVVTGAVTLAVAGASSPAFAQSTDRSPNMPDNILDGTRTGHWQTLKMLILLALPRGLEPLFSP